MESRNSAGTADRGVSVGSHRVARRDGTDQRRRSLSRERRCRSACLAGRARHRRRRPRTSRNIAGGNPRAGLEGHPLARLRQHRRAPHSRARRRHDLLQPPGDLPRDCRARGDLRHLLRSRQHRQTSRRRGRLRPRRSGGRGERAAHARRHQGRPDARLHFRDRPRHLALERERRHEVAFRHAEHRLRRAGEARLREA